MSLWTMIFGNKIQNGTPQYSDPSKPNYIDPRSNGTRHCPDGVCTPSRVTYTDGSYNASDEVQLSAHTQQNHMGNSSAARHRHGVAIDRALEEVRNQPQLTKMERAAAWMYPDMPVHEAVQRLEHMVRTQKELDRVVGDAIKQADRVKVRR